MVDYHTCIKSIRAAVSHLHSLGLAHNNIIPDNIMMDQNDKPILIGFGSCVWSGHPVPLPSIPGWCDEIRAISAAEKDELELNRLEVWLKLRSTAEENMRRDLEKHLLKTTDAVDLGSIRKSVAVSEHVPTRFVPVILWNSEKFRFHRSQ
jgi:hypothetical protein